MLLTIQNINKRFGETAALNNVTFSLSQGEFVSIIGPSGAGKTTLLRILNGALSCDSGTILLEGAHLETAKGRAKRHIQKQIGTIYQDFALVENSTCRQNVLSACLPDMPLFPAVCGLFGKARHEEAERLLSRVGLSDKIDDPVKTLSGGQKQRVSIARALMRHPSLLLADEPVASLDPVTGRQILELLRDIRQTEGVSILMNSHNLTLSTEFSCRLIGLNAGSVVFDGAVSEFTEEVLTAVYGSARGQTS